MRDEIRKIQELMEAAEYVTDAPIATSVHLALTLQKPLLIEGHAGVGKTEVAKVMARVLGTNLIRLQCYEGLDASTALYEWNYQKQLLHIKLGEDSGHSLQEKEAEIFSEPFLLRRPLLQAITQDDRPPVLLVDETDRCVAAGTLIATSSGIKRAEEIEPGDEVVSFNPAEFRITHARVKKVIPRETSSVLRILVGGRFLETTGEHRFVRYSAAGYEVVRASELRAGDRLPLHKTTQAPGLREPDFEFPDTIVKLTEAGKRMLHAAYKASGRTYEAVSSAVGISRSHLRNVIQPSSCRNSFRAKVLQRLASELELNGRTMPSEHCTGLRIRQSVSFYEILGYIVADGCFTSDRLSIADKDHANLEIYAQKFHEAFGVRPRILKGPHRNWELTHHSLPLGRFLTRVLGPGLVRSRARAVPGFVFSLSTEKRAGFVRGFFDGEAWVADHQVAVTSSSPYLLAGVQHLLSSLGVDGHISKVSAHPRSFGEGDYFTLSVSDVEAFASAVGFNSIAKQARLASHRRPHRFTRTETLPKGPVFVALERLRDQVVLSGVPVEVRELLDRDVVLGQVTSIERVDQPQAVYDLVLDGTPYFIANQIVTHNCDEEFEAFMLEVFSDWQVTIPEIGTITATHPPHVILTSNRTRELSDALRRRCLYLWIDYPSFDKEVRIVERKVPGINARLARELARFMEHLRTVRLAKVPGVAETLDWAQALASLHADHLDEALVGETLGCVLKDADDIKRFRAEVAKAGLGPFLPVAP
ncbi:MAG: hypothetical protein HY727_22105 [Candidatus Rokubacteria bacterium]|nr:hypothetical protein [Candidatus Rokubacteria bacterium]